MQSVIARQQTLTDEERGAVGRAVDWLERWQQTHWYRSPESGDLKTLRGLLERHRPVPEQDNTPSTHSNQREGSVQISDINELTGKAG